MERCNFQDPSSFLITLLTSLTYLNLEIERSLVRADLYLQVFFSISCMPPVFSYTYIEWPEQVTLDTRSLHEVLAELQL